MDQLVNSWDFLFVSQNRDWGVKSSFVGRVGGKGHRIRKWNCLLCLLNQDPILIPKLSVRRKGGDTFYSCII